MRWQTKIRHEIRGLPPEASTTTTTRISLGHFLTTASLPTTLVRPTVTSLNFDLMAPPELHFLPHPTPRPLILHQHHPSTQQGLSHSVTITSAMGTRLSLVRKDVLAGQKSQDADRETPTPGTGSECGSRPKGGVIVRPRF